MMFASLIALAGVAVVDHTRRTRRQTNGSGLGLVPLRMHPCSWSKGGVKFLLAHHPRLAVPQASYLGCPLLVSVLLWRWRGGWCCCGGVAGEVSVPSGAASCGTGNQIGPTSES